MKKAILALALVMSIGATQVSLASSAPKHRYHPTTQQVDSKAAPASAAPCLLWNPGSDSRRARRTECRR